MIRSPRLARFLLLVAFGLAGRDAFAQQGGPVPAPGPAAPAGSGAPNGSGAKLARPTGEPLRVENIDPALMRILVDWSQKTKSYTKLEGECQRFTYDHVFEVEKHASGYLYYEAPDKGRIDIEAVAVPKNVQGQRAGKKKNAAGEPFKVEPDKSERWICNGRAILLVDDAQKQVDMFPIPPQKQGTNIMDGPLPFLFGLPPEEAVRRFQLKLLREDANQCWIHAIPRRQDDAANYKEATIILERQRWLPIAVRLLDPSGNTEIVYSFGTLTPNKGGLLVRFRDNPFGPSELRSYKLVSKQPPTPPAPVAGGNGPPAENAGIPMPSLIGLGARDAKALLDKAGIPAKFLKGRPAMRAELNYVVYEQDPPAKSAVAKDKTVTVTCFDLATTQTSANVPK